ncbi:Hsp20/alpha crystallin family protein [Cohnella thermotolerans]|uniref:Hsp20/alpha crystallin family protein n=1 Tax=Cohnella thermotolerans TaxID=329858 RepID=UPI000402EB06|nr:Hsp20/alpha crystallin family protein [Cohnella thermotolerans]
MDQGRPNVPKDFYSQATEVLGEEFWQELGELLPNAGPRVDMYETPSAVVVLAELPGLQSPEQVRVRLYGQTLELEGDLPCPYPVTGNRIALSERFFGHFRRSLSLPKPVSPDAIAARYAKGLLIVNLPIDGSDKQTSIPVEFGPSG